jgi:alpha-tubulin suppressor-like RCC1 family protein
MCLGLSIKNQPSGARHGLSLALGTFVFLLTACVSPSKLGAAEVVRWGDSAFGMDVVPAGATDVIAIAGGADHSVVLRGDGSTVAWGLTIWGATAPTPGGVALVGIAVGYDHNVGLLADGTVVAWGRNDKGQCILPVGLDHVVQVAANEHHNLALKDNGTVVAWGANDALQNIIPAGLNNVVSVACGAFHNLALKRDGTVVAWGSNEQGQSSVPVGLANVIAISAGERFSLALKADGTVVAWGFNVNGQATVPVGLNNVVMISAGLSHAMALRNDGTVVAWGLNANGQTDVPAGLSGVRIIGAGYWHSLTATGPKAPRIMRQPAGQSLLSGNPLSLRVEAVGTLPLNYQWQRNTVDVPGQTGPVLNIASAQTGDAGTYRVVIDNTEGTINSAGVAVVVTEEAPIITQHPNNVSTRVGATAVLTVTAEGSAPLTYQWFKGATLLGGKTASSLVLNDLQVSDSGVYTVEVTNPLGTETSNPATLSVSPITHWGEGGLGQGAIPASANDAVAIASGGAHNLALKANGTVVAWGYNPYGQTDVPASLANVVAISSGYDHNLALKSDGTVTTWGRTDFGLGIIPAGLNNVVAVSANEYHSMALKADGTVVVWGKDSGPGGSLAVPAGLDDVVAIAAGVFHNLALRSDGTVVAWGNNNFLQTDVPGDLTDVIAIAAGGEFSLAVKRDGTVRGWGANYNGQINIPAGLSDVVDIAAGYGHAVALKGDGTVVSWGRNGAGQATPPAGLGEIWGISAGFEFSMALGGITAPVIMQQPKSQSLADGETAHFFITAAGTLPLRIQWQKGTTDLEGETNHFLALPNVQSSDEADYRAIVENDYGQLISSVAHLTVSILPPTITQQPESQTAYVGDTVILSVSAGGTPPLTYQWYKNDMLMPGKTAALLTLTDVRNGDNGSYKVLVSNPHGSELSSTAELHVLPVVPWGDNTFGQGNIPIAATNAIAISCGGGHNTAVRADGTVLAWGLNPFGQINVPVGLSGVVQVGSGYDHNLALKSDGTVVAWGRINDGESTVPGGLTDVIAVSANGHHSLALKNDGTVVAWGLDSSGQGHTPPGLTGVTAISAGAFHNLALLGDGTVFAWGANGAHQTEVPAGLTGVIAVAAGGNFSLALKADGTVVAWGGTIVVPETLANVTAIAAGDSHALAIKADRTVVGWGANGSGQATPPVGLSRVTAISAGFVHSLALLEGDSMPPQITTCPSPGSVNANLNCQAAIPDLTGQAVAVDDLDPDPILTQSPTAGTLVGFGPHTVTITATDHSGNSSTCPTTVTVLDNTPPLVTLVGANPLGVECHGILVDPGATANDACDGSRGVTVSGTVNVNLPGSYTLTYSATDLSANLGSTTRTVNVVDTTKPVITLTGANPIVLKAHHAFVDPGATAQDLCAGTVTVNASGTVDINTVGSYTVTYSATDGYNTQTATRTVNVIADDPVVTWNTPAAITYGAALGVAQLNATANVPGAFVYNPPAGTVLQAGPRTLSVSFTPTDSINYNGAGATVQLTVNQAVLTITAQTKTKVYGAPLPGLTAGYSGFVGADDPSSLTTPPSLETTATQGSSVGGYPITVSGATAANYSINFVPGTLSVTRAALSVTAENKAKLYGAALPSFSASYEGFVNGDTVSSLDAPATFGTAATAASAAGTYAITVTAAADANYTVTFHSGLLTVNPRGLTITAEDKTRSFMQPNPTLTASYNGFVLGEGPSVLTSPVQLATDAVLSSSPGNYSITPSGAAAANYAISYVNGTLTVLNGVAPVVTLPVGNLNYTENAPATILDATATVSDTDTPNFNGGTMTIELVVNGTPDDRLAIHNEGNGAGQIGVTGNQVAFGGVTIGSFTGGTDGTTPLAISLNDQVSPAVAQALLRQVTFANVSDLPSSLNRTVHVVLDDGHGGISAPASMTVTVLSQPDSPVLTWATPAPIVYGTALGAGQLNATTSVAGSFAYTPAAGTVLHAGDEQTLSVTFTPDDEVNYTAVSTTVKLNVSRAPLTITADNKTKVYGSINPPLTAQYVGLVNADTPESLDTSVSLGAAATTGSAVGNYQITVGGAADPDYTITFVNGTLSVTRKALTITAEDKSRPFLQPNPPLTATYSGFFAGDGPSNLNTPVQLNTTANLASLPGSYTITASGATADNYTINHVNGTLTVESPSDPVVTLPAGNLNYTENAGPVVLDPNATVSDLDTLTFDGGSLTIDFKVNGTADDRLAIRNQGNGVGQIGVSGSQVTYGGLVIGSFTGGNGGATPLVISCNVLVLPLVAQELLRQITYENVSELPSTLTRTVRVVLDDGHGGISSPATMTVSVTSLPDSPPLTWATPAGIVYGTALGASQLNANSSVAGTFAYTPAAGTVLHAGENQTLSVTFTPDDNVNYTPLSTTVELDVAPALLTITADNKSKAYGSANPTLTAHYEGLVNADTPESLNTPVALGTTATAASPVGSYQITAGGAQDPDYAISFANGTLTVNPKALTITADNKTRPFMQPNPTLTASYNGFVLGEGPSVLTSPVQLATDAGLSSSPGSYPITPSGAAAANYAISYVNGTLTVLNGVAPVVTLPVGNLNYTENAPVTILDATATVSDTDTPNLSGGTMTIDLTVNGTPDDRLAIHNEGNGAGQIGVTGNQVAFGGVTIGSFTGGTDGTTPLVISLNDQASPAVAQALLRQVTFANASDLPSTLTRTVHVVIDDGHGGVSAPASMTVTVGSQPDNPVLTWATPAPIVYGTALGAGQLNATASVAGSFAYTPAAGTVLHAGDEQTLSVTFTPDDEVNYMSISTTVKLNVSPAPLTITADNKSKLYGTANPALTASYGGFVNGDNPASLNIPVSLSTSPALQVGTYDISASGAFDPDYSITFFQGTLTVTPAALLITADDQSKVYGATLPTLTVHYSGFVGGDTPASLDTPPTVGTAATAASAVGTYAITASGAAAHNYAIAYAPGLLTVTRAPLTVTAQDRSKVYGADLPSFGASYTGFVNGDGEGSLDTPPTFSTTATAASNVGTYAINVSAAADANYTVSFVPGTLTVTAKLLTVTADNKTKVYGTGVPTLTASYDGFASGDTPASLDTAVTLTTAATASSVVGDYPIIVSGGADANYMIQFVNGTLAVTRAPLTATAHNLSKVYGKPLPALTVQYTGLVNGETTIDTPPVLTTTATAASHVGTYPINISGGADPNYTITHVNGTLTVSPANISVRADDKTMLYGGAVPTLTVSYFGLVNGDTPASLTSQGTAVTLVTSTTGVGTYLIVVSGAMGADYAISHVNGTLTVTRAPLVVTAENKSKPYGAALPEFTASYSGFVNSETPAVLTTPVTFSTTATAASNGGTYAIHPNGATAANYAITFVDGTLTITRIPLTITAEPKSKVYGAALPTFTASFNGFINGDTPASLDSPVTFTSTASQASNVGTYSITPGGAADVNYSMVFVNGTLTVTPAPLTIQADAKTKLYLAALPTLTATYTGLVNGDTPTSLDTPVNLTTTADQLSPVGTYPIHASGAVDANYVITHLDSTLTVTELPAQLVLSGISEAGDVSLQITCQPGLTLDLEESADLATWTRVTTLEAPSGALTYVHVGAGNVPLKFYRLKVIE